MKRLLDRGGLVLLIGAIVGAGAPLAAGSSRFPPSIYPPPVRSRGGALAACPNPAGLQSFTTSATATAKRSASRYLRVSEVADLHGSDRAWWPLVRQSWRSRKPGKGPGAEAALGSEPASRSGYAVIVRYSCGQPLVARSLLVTIGAPNARCVACRSQVFFIDRRGRVLIYFVY
jgi:hypothetical protein